MSTGNHECRAEFRMPQDRSAQKQVKECPLSVLELFRGFLINFARKRICPEGRGRFNSPSAFYPSNLTPRLPCYTFPPSKIFISPVSIGGCPCCQECAFFSDLKSTRL